MLKQKPITLVNECGAIYSEKKLIAAMLWVAQDPMKSRKKVFMYGRYPAVSVGRNKYHIHRLLIAYENDGLGNQFYVHHKDGNRLNATRKNLEIMRASEHQSITNKGRKQSPEWINKRLTNSWKTRRKIYENPNLLN